MCNRIVSVVYRVIEYFVIILDDRREKRKDRLAKADGGEYSKRKDVSQEP